MKIAIGALLCEGNSLTPVKTRFEDFDYAPGAAMYEKVAVLDLLQARNCEIVPTLYAHALPGGPVVKADYLRLAGEILDGIPADVDGVWLYLHGAMCVEGIGSGEAWLLRALREKIGYRVPVSVSMDFHADNADEIPELVNVVTGYRTAPHTDREQAQRHGVALLFRCLDRGLLPQPQLARADVVICGDAVQTGEEPLKGIMAEAARMEREIPGMLSVQVFNGQPWIDEPYMGPNFVVTHETDTALARDCAEKLARMFWEVRHDFRFEVEALAPDDAIRAAMASEVPVFLSDSGDNTTAGAAGDNAFLLGRLQALGAKSVLLAGIMDAAACDACYRAAIGDTLTLRVGGSLDPRSKSAEITGRLVHRGDILSYQHDNGGPSATLDCGDMTVVITKNRASLCRPDIFASIDLDYKAFHIVAVKLGYLFPELAAEAQRSILAFTPGASTERLADMHLKNIRRPMYPLEDDFM